MSAAPQHAPVRSPRWPLLIDGALDGGIVAGALWTLWYQAGLIWQFDLRPSGWVFAVVTLVCLVVGARRELLANGVASAADRDAAAVTAPVASSRHPALRSTLLRPALLLAVLVLLIWTVSDRASLGVVPLAIVVILIIVTVTWPAWAGGGRAAVEDTEPASRPGTFSHLIALLASLGIGVLSLFIFKPDADDAYYVNRAAWVAEHGTAVLRDTMFGSKTFPNSFGGGLPTPSIEALQGVLASMLGVEAGTLAYLIYAPVLAAVFVWVTWRLVRAWAPRRHLLVLLVGLLFVLASGSSIIGSYSVGRIWQGKVTAYAVLVPLVWTYLSRAAERRSRSTTVLLFAAGIVFVGLTTSSALLMPVIVGAALLAALALRSRALLIGAIAFAIGPLVNGVVQVFGSSDIGNQANGVGTADQVFAIAFGAGTAMAVLAVIATAIAPGVLRRSAAVVAGAAGVATTATFVPGVIGLANAATGAGPVVWRLAIVAPTWVFVGLLVALPGSEIAGRLSAAVGKPFAAVAAGVIAVAVALTSVTAGHWLWSHQVGGRLTSSPRWKVAPAALADVRAARALDVAPGLWLMPPAQMQNLSISTTSHAVVPRIFYLDTLDAPAQAITDRRVLFALASGRRVPAPAVGNVRDALQRLDVSLACVPGSSKRARRTLAAAVQSSLRSVGSMRCDVLRS